MICLCADWCGLCRDYRAVFAEVAAIYPDVKFVWVDIEDEAALLGDLDVETFPTLLVMSGNGIAFLGPLTPQAEILARLLASVLKADQAMTPHTPFTRGLLSALPLEPRLWLQR